MDSVLRKELVRTANDHLANVIGASGKPEELVRLTTEIVKATRSLCQGTPEATQQNSTVILAAFVKAAKAIAQNPRAVDSASLQQLSASKKAVETLVCELDEWHSSGTRDEGHAVLQRLCSDGPADAGPTDQEKKLADELRRHQVSLTKKKKEPQTEPPQHGRPEEVLGIAIRGLEASSQELAKVAAEEKSPTRKRLFEPMLTIVKMVNMLLDVVDSLFVSKYPMRSQVHTFCCTLLDSVLSYKEKGKSEDTSILRTLQTQPSAMLSAIEVMSEQCQSRLQDLEANQQKSIMRTSAIHDLDNDIGKPPSPQPKMHNRPPPPQPPVQTKRLEEPPKKKEFEIYCILSTNVAVDPKTNLQIPKGTEVALKATSDTTVLEVKKELALRTGIPINQIQVKFRGDDTLPDSTKVNSNNPVPYFMFNEFEPSEESLQEWKKELRKKNKVKLEDVDWSQFKSTVGIALFDNEVFEEGGSWLSFDEGDVIEIIEKTPDGWCEGILNGLTGTFPASFVLEVQPPRSKEELKQLIKLVNLKKKSPDAELDIAIGEDRKSVGRNSPQPKSKAAETSQNEFGHTPRLMEDRRASEQVLDHSPQLRPKMNVKRKGVEEDRRTSEPVIPLMEQGKNGKLKRTVKELIKRKTQGAAWDEEGGGDKGVEGLKPRSPILSGRSVSASSPSQPSEEERVKAQGVPEPGKKVAPLRPPEPAGAKLSPQIPMKGIPSPQSRSKRPPPPPPPFSVTHGSKSSPEEQVKSPIPVLITDEGEEGGGVRDKPGSGEGQGLLGPSTAPPIKSSASMEQLFETLREFDEATENDDPIARTKPDRNFTTTDYTPIPEKERPVPVPKRENQPESDNEESSPSPELPVPARSGSISALTPVSVRSSSIPGPIPACARSGSTSGSSVPPVDDAPPTPPERHISSAKAKPQQPPSHIGTAPKNDSSGDETPPLSPVQSGSQAKSSTKAQPQQPNMQKQGISEVAPPLPSEQAPPPQPERLPSRSVSRPHLSQPPVAAASKQSGSEAPPIPTERPALPSKPVSRPSVSGPSRQEDPADEAPPIPTERPALPSKPVSRPSVSGLSRQEDPADEAPPIPTERPALPSKPVSKSLPSQQPQASPKPDTPVLEPVTVSKPQSPTPAATKQSSLGNEAPPRPPERPSLPTKVLLRPAPSPPTSAPSAANSAPSPAPKQDEATKPSRLLVKPVFRPPPPPNGPPPSEQTAATPPKLLVSRQTAPELPPVHTHNPVQNQTKLSPSKTAHNGGAKVKRNASFSPSSSRNESPDEQKIQEYLGSPVVMRRTKAVVGEANSRQLVTSDDMDDCTGVGKEGVLYKEAAGNAEWKARYFQLLGDKLIYFESDSLPQDDKQLGEVLCHRMQRAVPLDKREGYHCFAINMKYETSVVLATTISSEMDDWIRSINKMISMARLRNPKQLELLWYGCASKCLDYMLEGKRLEEVRVLLSSAGNQALISKWLNHLEKGEEPDLSCIPDTSTAAAFLKCILKDKLPRCLISQERAKELCDMMRTASPLSTLATRLQELADEPRALLKQLLNMFGQALEYCDINKTAIGDLNHCFGPLIFEKLSTAQRFAGLIPPLTSLLPKITNPKWDLDQATYV
ncbi:hypothetical protein EMCRGX_G033991 [Ephydatia muelleri]